MNELTTTLPQLAAIFRGIKTGHHWCFGDPEYADLSGERFEDYKAFFAQLELTLHRDSRGFIFATSDDDDYKGSDQITRFVVFTAIWVDAVADVGDDIGQTLFAPDHSAADLPHLHADAYRRNLAEVGVNTDGDLLTVLRGMERLGFLVLDAEGRFSLREAFHRLLDVCLNARANPEKDQGVGSSEGAGLVAGDAGEGTS